MENSIILKHEDWSAEILPSFGANVICLKKGNKNILRSPISIEELEKSPYLFGMPLLFPPNRTENGKFTFEDVEYCFPINEPSKNNHLHGLLYNVPFTVMEHEANSVKCMYNNNDASIYPFRFMMTITCTLDLSGFMQEVVIENTDKISIPIQIAFHTTFEEPAFFKVPIGESWETNSNYIPTGKLIELNQQEREYRTGCAPKMREISGFYTSIGNTAEIGDFYYHVSNNYTQWILYNGSGREGFLCIEPQSGPVNGLNMPRGYTRIETGESVCFSTRITHKDSAK